jgi:CheY-like chemotaxis protein
VRLVRELLTADVEPAVVRADAAGRAARYLGVVSDGLGLRAGAILFLDAATNALSPAASTFSGAATESLTDGSGRGLALARRAVDERRALVARRSADDPLVRALHDSDPSVDTVAILPLVDRVAVGVLVLAGNETTLAVDVIRTLNPALRLLALLVSPYRDGVSPPAHAIAQAELDAERDAAMVTLLALEAQVTELQAALDAARAAAVQGPEPAPILEAPAPTPAPSPVARVEAVAAENARQAAALEAAAVRADEPPAAESSSPVVAGSPDPASIVVVDTAIDWARYPIAERRILTVPPATESAAIGTAAPGRIVLNVAAPGALAYAVALRASGVTAPILGVVAHAGSEQVIGLGVVEAVGHPLVSEALVLAVECASPRGARVFAAGRDAEALLKMRQALAKRGLSVSLARDTKQIDELLAMVRPQVVVIDLALPMRQGYELVMRMAATTPVPAMVLIATENDPSPVFVDKLRDRIAAGMGTTAAQWLAQLAAQQLPSKTVARPKTSAPAP